MNVPMWKKNVWENFQETICKVFSVAEGLDVYLLHFADVYSLNSTILIRDQNKDIKSPRRRKLGSGFKGFVIYKVST